MSKPLISIVIPFYKKFEYIDQTFKTIFNQTYKNFEILIIYDDENLNDYIKLKNTYKKNKRIKIIKNSKNKGAGVSRNIGIKASKGKYIAFIDADDLWLKSKLKYQLNLMERNKYNFSHTSYFIINKNNFNLGKRTAVKKLSYKKLLNSCDIGLSTVMIKKSFLKNLNFPPLKTKEDYVLWLNLSKKEDLIGINKYLTKWRKTDESLSSNTFQKLLDGFRVYYQYMDFGLFKSFYSLFILSLNYLKK